MAKLSKKSGKRLDSQRTDCFANLKSDVAQIGHYLVARTMAKLSKKSGMILKKEQFGTIQLTSTINVMRYVAGLKCMLKSGKRILKDDTQSRAMDWAFCHSHQEITSWR